MRFQNSVVLASFLTALAAYSLPQNENGGSDTSESSAVESGDGNADSTDTAISADATGGPVADGESTDVATVSNNGANSTVLETLAVATASSAVTAASGASEKEETAAASVTGSAFSSEGSGTASGIDSTASGMGNSSSNSTDSSGALQVAGLPAGFEWVIGSGAMVVGALGAGVATLF
ncbi:hypothetical protein J010_01198 [Cryptococcus neoformans]|nr:hypothetical protein C355_01325 [Cryptococcus neoformans var. grubii Th84]OXG91240.1 hypothetical protein C346_01267 [Cryptococcus neoformans var. grubii D17-1]OXG98635.1 hypothetical protein C345_01223 [Cryptococcus neoformans var. grubii A2-102-5]OXH16285.1 hypothetical protein J010_01198 [Cryptococcus neoformans var. grubii]OXH36569.1 hypothetical protein J009_01210 [Cryptococcus neoformans var. grubii]